NIIVKGGSPAHVSELVLQLEKKIEVKYFEGRIHLNQSKYVVDLLSKTEITLAKVVATSLGKNMVWMKLWEVLGLVYIKPMHSTCSRGKKDSQVHQRLYGYSDVDLAGCTTTRRSTTCYSSNLGANYIS
uniref:Reverse transcriptase Ty1/copia-type domain-containing protein n=1 Tax=Solanum lycopersicum TaxID=4081 RepID=A0A3Q7JC61_SOLLC